MAEGIKAEGVQAEVFGASFSGLRPESLQPYGGFHAACFLMSCWSLLRFSKS